MKHQTSVQDLLFDVDQVPIEAVVGSNGSTRRISIPGKKALVNKGTGLVLGVVSRDYRVVTNREAVNLARDVCEKAFPGLSSVEWEAKCAAAPRTLSYAFIDLMHKTHVLNYWDSEIKKRGSLHTVPPRDQQLQRCPRPPVRHRLHAQALLQRRHLRKRSRHHQSLPQQRSPGAIEPGLCNGVGEGWWSGLDLVEDCVHPESLFAG